MAACLFGRGTKLNFIQIVCGIFFLALVLIAWRTGEKSNKRELDYDVTVKTVQGEILPSPEARQSKRGYVLTLKFTGQQAAGVRGIFSQQCWLKLFGLPMSIVEPFVNESVISHSKKL